MAENTINQSWSRPKRQFGKIVPYRHKPIENLSLQVSCLKQRQTIVKCIVQASTPNMGKDIKQIPQRNLNSYNSSNLNFAKAPGYLLLFFRDEKVSLMILF